MKSFAVLLPLVFVFALSLAGCASTTPQGYMTTDELVLALVRNDVDPARVILPYGLTPEMQAWARETAGASANPLDRLFRLQERLLNPEEMALEYAWGYTGTAVEVFEQRRANCLAFTNLFVGMSRSVGIPVYFLAVEIGETYRRDGDLVILSDHIAVGYGPQTQRTIFDFSENPESDNRTFQPISDLRALAMFHSNRSAEALQIGYAEPAIEWGETAVSIDPELASAWVNLGVAYRRAGSNQDAEKAYRRALEVDPRTESAYQNLLSLMRIEGRHAEALSLEQFLLNTPRRNPFTYLALGDISVVAQRFGEAERLYRRALRIDPDLGEGHAALGQIALMRGDRNKAKRLLRKARKYDPQDDRVLALESSLQR